MISNFSRKRINRSKELRNIFNMFVHNQATGGVVLLLCAVIALLIANIPEISYLHDIWYEKLAISFGDKKFEMDLIHWINDGLMAIFFFVVGLEIKREVLVGELSSLKQATLPIFAAIGGMLFPALIYAFFNHGEPSQNGWGIPMATDIAFSLGIISILGKKVPLTLKIFLTALAIVDDLGAIIVLALFYPTHAIDFQYLMMAGGIILLLLFLNKINIQKPAAYLILGVALWFLVLASGIHATIAGVILAAFIPYKTPINEVRFYARSRFFLEKFRAASRSELMVLANPVQQEIIHSLHNKLEKINPLMHKFEHGFHPWVTYLIMPIFALANAGVIINSHSFEGSIPPIALGVFFGLVFGKPLGIFALSWVACKLKIAVLPEGVKWGQIASVGIIAGIGFTMSIFIDNLAFSDPKIVDTGKAAILISSFVSAVLGLLALYITTRKKKPINK